MNRIWAWVNVILGRAVRLNGVTFRVTTTTAHLSARKSPHWKWGPTVDLVDRHAELGVGYVWLRVDDRRPLFIVNPASTEITKVWELPAEWIPLPLSTLYPAPRGEST